jgi:hypothetical protein
LWFETGFGAVFFTIWRTQARLRIAATLTALVLAINGLLAAACRRRRTASAADQTDIGSCGSGARTRHAPWRRIVLVAAGVSPCWSVSRAGEWHPFCAGSRRRLAAPIRCSAMT